MHLSPKGRVLCVEDNADTSLMISTLLQQSGYEVQLATTIADGLTLARTGAFDLYLLDNKLPDGSGLELCERIREFAPSAPIVFHTAAAYEADRQRGFAAGAQAYLTKPEGSDHLVDIITNLIGNHGLIG